MLDPRLPLTKRDLANISVLITADLIFLTHSPLPDLLIELLLTGKVLFQGWRKLQA